MSSQRTSDPAGAGWLGYAVATALGALAAAVVYLANPLFFDRPGWSALLFLFLPGAAGFLLGLAAGALSSRPARAGARRGALVVLFLALLVQVGVNVGSARREAHPAHRLRMLVVGVDGATWDIVRPMMERGELPEWSRLCREGSSAVCRSLPPMFSNRVFTSVATGKVAEKHGIVGVSDTAEQLKAARLWDILGARGWVTGTMEWYVTWPPEVRTSGFTIPDLYARSNVTMPAELSFLRDLRIGAKGNKHTGPLQAARYATALVTHGLRLSTFVEAAKLYLEIALHRLDYPERYYRQHYVWIRLKTDVFCRLVETFGLDYGGMVMKLTDSLAHKYWRFFEPEAFDDVSPESVDRFGDVIPGAYRLVDGSLARLARRLQPDGVMAVVSDHGFRAATRTETGVAAIRTGTLLEVLGLDKKGWDYVNIGGAACLMPLGERDAPEEESSRELAEVARLFRTAVVRGTGEPAFYVELNDKPGNGDDHVAVGLRRDLVERLDEQPVVRFANGDTIAVADLVLSSDLSGDHDDRGVLILDGAAIRAGAVLDTCSILDVTPTLLALVGLPVGADMDGHVLVDAMTQEFRETHPVTAIETYDTDKYLPHLTSQPETDLPPDVLEKLRALGYVQ